MKQERRTPRFTTNLNDSRLRELEKKAPSCGALVCRLLTTNSCNSLSTERHPASGLGRLRHAEQRTYIGTLETLNHSNYRPFSVLWGGAVLGMPPLSRNTARSCQNAL